MTEQSRQDRFQESKDDLDKAIRILGRLASAAAKEGIACCKMGEPEGPEQELYLLQRDQFGELAAHLRQAQGMAEMARAKAGRINGGGIVAGGGT